MEINEYFIYAILLSISFVFLNLVWSKKFKFKAETHAITVAILVIFLTSSFLLSNDKFFKYKTDEYRSGKSVLLIEYVRNMISVSFTTKKVIKKIPAGQVGGDYTSILFLINLFLFWMIVSLKISQATQLFFFIFNINQKYLNND